MSLDNIIHTRLYKIFFKTTTALFSTATITETRYPLHSFDQTREFDFTNTSSASDETLIRIYQV